MDWVIDHLRANLHRPVKLAELAQVACLSEFHFHRIFTAISGETLNNFTTRLRLEKAARLLRYSEQSLTEIGLDCGFSSSATFSRAFRCGYETSPSQFRKSGEIKKSKIRKELKWSPQESFESALRRTVEWYLANETWWRPLRAVALKRLGLGDCRRG